MKCKQAKEMISLYIDHMLSTKEKLDLEEHIKECKECNNEYLALLKVVNNLKDIEEAPFPKDFDKELKNALEEIHGKKNTLRNKTWSKGFLKWASLSAMALVGIFLIIFFIGPYSPLEASQQMSSEMARDEEKTIDSAKMNIESSNTAVIEEEKQQNVDTPNESIDDSISTQSIQRSEEALPIENIQEKIIYSANITLQVNELEETFESILQYTKNIGGYVQNSSTYSPDYGIVREDNRIRKEGNLSLKVPQEKFEEVIKEIEKMGNVKSVQRAGENITTQYRDIDVEINNLEIQEKRLLEIMENANKIEDILQIERELNRIRTEINQRKNTLKNWNQLVDYSSIEIYIQEEKISGTNIEASPFANLGLKIQKGFIQSINLIVKGIVTLILFTSRAIPFIIIIIILYWIYRKWLKDKLKQRINK